MMDFGPKCYICLFDRADNFANAVVKARDTTLRRSEIQINLGLMFTISI
jgi:hypothetical protein